VEQVKVTYETPDGAGYKGLTHQITPDVATRSATARLKAIRSIIGQADMSAETAAAHANKMQLVARAGSAVVAESGTGEAEAVIICDVPITRADILHECDVVEDVAIAHGYNNIALTIPRTPCPGAQQPLNKLTDALRVELAACGYDEVLTLALVSREENFGMMGLPEDGSAVELGNPEMEGLHIGRTRMVPGLLRSLHSNKGKCAFSGGVRLFEVSDVMLRDASVDVGARNERRLAALYSGVSAGFEVVHGLVDRLMQLLEVPVRPFSWQAPAAAAGAGAPATAAAAGTYGRGGLRYFLEPEEGIPTYFPGRGARVVLEHESGARTVLGSVGVLHPRVIKAFGLDHPASVVELNIEPFLKQ
jgi:phenylalanyl-tRNA synthetase beta chain